MEVTTIPKARALAMIELDALANKGKVRLADCIQPMVKKYDFQVFPTKPEDFDLEKKGVKFESGRANGLLIDVLTIYNGAIALDTLSSTGDSKAILLDLLEWGNADLGLSFKEKQIRRWAYISHVVFESEISLVALCSSPLQKLAEKTSSVTEKIFDGLSYVPSQVWIGHDPSLRQHSVASLFIAHRVGTPYAGKTFFSEAPLPTDLHIQFLREFEQDVREQYR